MRCVMSLSSSFVALAVCVADAPTLPQETSEDQPRINSFKILETACMHVSGTVVVNTSRIKPS